MIDDCNKKIQVINITMINKLSTNIDIYKLNTNINISIRFLN